LVAAIHRRLGRAFDGTITRVMACMINKLRAKMRKMRLYIVRDPPGTGGSLSENLEKHCSAKN